MKAIKNLSAVAMSVIAIVIAEGQQHVTDHINKLMPNPIPQAPNVAALGKFGDYQVNHFNGIPDISIPLYEVKSGGLSVPITLSYHASGIKPTDIASWVGLGWSLSAGGEIARNVQGKPDELGFQTSTVNINATVCNNFYYLRYIYENVEDAEADIFSYSFPGKSGKFMLPYGSSPLLYPYAPLVISPSAGYGKFEITDENGVLYRFGQNAQAVSAVDVTTATNGGNPTINNVTTAWHLMDMVAPNSNDQISFSYQLLGQSMTHDISYVYTVYDQCQTYNQGSCPPQFNYTPQLQNTDSWATQKGLQTITFETGKVDFIMGPVRSDVPLPLNRLGQILIYGLLNGEYQLEKTIDFTFSYFTNGNGGNQALKLDGIQIKDKDNQVVQQYNFSYFTNSFSWNVNSSAFLNARDLWGYFNAAYSNTDLLPPTTIGYNPSGAQTENITFGGGLDRNVNPTYSKEGVLKRIAFPTGGYTEFDYENNKYLKDGNPTLIGGLRVTTVSSYDGSGAAPVIKKYRYGQNESGNGIPNFRDTDFNYNSTQKFFFDNCTGVEPGADYQVRVFLANSSLSKESPIMYPYVTEYSGDPEGINNGKIIYEYDEGIPSLDVTFSVPTSSKKSVNSYAWKRGKLTEKTVYDNLGNIISTTSITNSLLKNSDNVVGLGSYQYVVGIGNCTEPGLICLNEENEPVHSQTYQFAINYQSAGVLVESNVSETVYQNGDIGKFVTTNRSSTFDEDKLQVLESTTTASNPSEEIVTVNLYPFQLNANQSSTGAAKAIHILNQKNVLTAPVETFTYRQTSGSNERMISGQLTTFRQNEANANFVVPDKINVWASASPVSLAQFTPVAINGSNSGLVFDPNYKERINMQSYDNEGNIQTASKTNDLSIAYLYGYNNALPIAEVVNAQNTKYTAFNNDTGNTAITVGGITPQSTSRTFTVEYTGNVVLKMGITGTPAFTTYVDYSGTLGGSTMTLTNGQSCGYDQVVFTNVAPATYTIDLTVRASSSGEIVGACGQIDFPKITSSSAGIIEFFYENFEEGSATGEATPHTGKKYWLGDYTNTFVKPNGRNYIIEYWYLSSNVWTFATAPYTNGMILTAGDAIDNVRIRPSDAQMKCYTYEPGVGMSSSIDERGKVYKYEYDAFGRLARIINENGSIEKQYSYHYKIQP